MTRKESPERTTLRLEPELAQRLDAFLYRNKHYHSRSHAMRVALERFLDQEARRAEDTMPEEDTGIGKVKLPPSLVRAGKQWVKVGEHFVDFDDAIRHIIRDYITQHVREVSESIQRIKVVSGEALDVSLEESEGKHR